MSQRRNWFLIAGVSLRAVLLLGFFAYSYVAGDVVEAPAYDLYFSTFANRSINEPRHATLAYAMQDGRIVVRATFVPNAASVRTQTRAILVTSVVRFLLYISYFHAEHFSDSLGWPPVLMLIGVAFVGVGYFAPRFNRRYFQA